MIEIRNLKKSFGDKEVLSGVNLDIEKGITLVIIGRSGCGKSVLLKHIIGLLTPDEGEILIEGQNITKMSEKGIYEIRKQFGFLFQGAALFDSMDVEQNIGLALKENTDMKKSEIKDIVAEKLELVGLPNIQKMKPSDLSGGMKKRVSLARSLATNPEYILYDEPTTGLDPITGKEIIGLMKEIQEKYNTSSLIISHDMNCDEVL